jgi:hypothetical protein
VVVVPILGVLVIDPLAPQDVSELGGVLAVAGPIVLALPVLIIADMRLARLCLPILMSNPRELLGLPDVNSGQHLTVAIARTLPDLTRPAERFDGTLGRPRMDPPKFGDRAGSVRNDGCPLLSLEHNFDDSTY